MMREVDLDGDNSSQGSNSINSAKSSAQNSIKSSSSLARPPLGSPPKTGRGRLQPLGIGTGAALGSVSKGIATPTPPPLVGGPFAEQKDSPPTKGSPLSSSRTFQEHSETPPGSGRTIVVKPSSGTVKLGSPVSEFHNHNTSGTTVSNNNDSGVKQETALTELIIPPGKGDKSQRSSTILSSTLNNNDIVGSNNMMVTLPLQDIRPEGAGGEGISSSIVPPIIIPTTEPKGTHRAAPSSTTSPQTSSRRNLNTGGAGGYDVVQNADHQATWEDENANGIIPIKRRRSVAETANDIVDTISANPTILNLSLLQLVLSFVVELYPSVPRYNVTIGAAFLWLIHTHSVPALKEKTFYYTLSFVALISLLIDLGFLGNALQVKDLADLANPAVPNSDSARGIAHGMDIFATILMVAVIIVKTATWQSILATSDDGRHALALIWRRMKLFIPLWGEPTKLTKEVYNRIIAIAWLHLMSGIGLIITAAITGLGYSWAPQFASFEGVGVSLSILIFVKGFTLLFVTGALFTQIDMALCLNVFGCMGLAQKWHKAREKRRRRKHGTTYPKVILTWDYVMLCAKIKAVDLAFGFWVWAGIGWSFQPDQPYAERWNIRAIMSSIVAFMFITDIWCMFLGIIVCLLISQYLLRKHSKKPNGEENVVRDSDEDNDVEITGHRHKDDQYDSETSNNSSSDGSTSESENEGSPLRGSKKRRKRRVTLSNLDIGFEQEAPPVNAYNTALYDTTFKQNQTSNRTPSSPANVYGAVILDSSFSWPPEMFHRNWDTMEPSGGFRVKVKAIPPPAALAGHLRRQLFSVVASGIVNGKTKVYACARNRGGTPCFFLMEMICDQVLYELQVTFKCQEPEATPSFVRHLRLGEIIPDHQPIG